MRVTIAPGQTVTVLRHGRAMALNNSGDTVVLVNPAGEFQITRTYGAAAEGDLIEFD